MSLAVVVDCSVYLAAFLPNEPLALKSHAKFQQWEDQKADICAPFLFRYEAVATVRKNVFRGRLTSIAAEKILQTLLNQRIRFFSAAIYLNRAYQLAEQFQLPTAYDAQYLAVAERLGCEFWTADEKLANAVSRVLSWVHWLGEI